MRNRKKQKQHRRTYKYQMREHPQNMRLGNMLDDLGDVHNHFLKLEQRYYRIYGPVCRSVSTATALDEVARTHEATLGLDTPRYA